MKKNNAKFIMVDSSLKGSKEFVVTYEVNGEYTMDFVFVDEKEGLTNSDYLRLAKKKFNSRKLVNKNPKTSSPLALKVIAGCAAVATVTFASLFTWKMLTDTSIKNEFYTVTWDLANGSEPIKEIYQAGEMPSYKGKTPVKADETSLNEDGMQYSYTFEGWLEELEPVTKNVTYTASYDAKSLYGAIDVHVTQDIIDDTTIQGTYTFNVYDDEEESNLKINWDYGSGSADDKIVSEESHQYTTPGLKKIRIYSTVNELWVYNDEPEFNAINQSIKRIVVPYYVKEIGQYFDEEDNYHSSWAPRDLQRLEKYSLPSDLEILHDAFSNVNSLSFIKLPANLKIIEENAFAVLESQKIRIFSKHIEEIKSGAFSDVAHFDDIHFNDVDTIESKAFSNVMLSELSFGSVKVCCDDAFDSVDLIKLSFDSVEKFGQKNESAVYNEPVLQQSRVDNIFINTAKLIEKNALRTQESVYNNVFDTIYIKQVDEINTSGFGSSKYGTLKIDKIGTAHINAFEHTVINYLYIDSIENAEGTCFNFDNISKICCINKIKNASAKAFEGTIIKTSNFVLPIITGEIPNGAFAGIVASVITVPDYYTVLPTEFLCDSDVDRIILPSTLTKINSKALKIFYLCTIDFTAIDVPPEIVSDSIGISEDRYDNLTLLVKKSTYDAYKNSWGAVNPKLVDCLRIA